MLCSRFVSASWTALPLFVALVASAVAETAGVYEQHVEPMPGSSVAANVPDTLRGDALWIWGGKDSSEYRLSKTFAGGAKRALITATADNAMTLLLNGKPIATSNDWQRPVTTDVAKLLVAGENELVALVKNESGAAGFACRLVLGEGPSVTIVESDESWFAADPTTPDDRVAARVVAAGGAGPWGGVLRTTANPGGPTESGFALPEGFAVERLFVVPREQLGSWVCLTTDPKGRLIASDQGDKGLVRITPAALDGSTPTVVERIPVPLTAAQGLLWAFDSLYVVCNGGPGSGLYRVTDSNDDDMPDKVEKLRAFEGGGEHGPHNILLSPDGQRLFVICGNHTKLPFGVRDVGCQRSRCWRPRARRLRRQHRPRRQDVGDLDRRLPQSLRHGVQRRR